MIKPFINYFNLDTHQLNDLFNLISEDGNKEINFGHFEELIYVLDDSKINKNDDFLDLENLEKEKKDFIILNHDQMKFLKINYVEILEIQNKENLFYFFKNACIFFEENLIESIMLKIKQVDLTEKEKFLDFFKLDENIPEFNMPSLTNIFEMPLYDKSIFLLKSIKIGYTKFFNFFNKFDFERKNKNLYYKLILNFQDDLFYRFERLSEIFQEYENYNKIMKSNLKDLKDDKIVQKKQEEILFQENLNLKATIGYFKKRI